MLRTPLCKSEVHIIGERSDILWAVHCTMVTSDSPSGAELVKKGRASKYTDVKYICSAPTVGVHRRGDMEYMVYGIHDITINPACG